MNVLGPSVIIVTANVIGTTSFVSRKPPRTLSLATVMNTSSMVCPSSGIFDMVGFLSVTLISVDDKLVLVARIEQRWRRSSSGKPLGDGEQRCQMFARSRIITLERLNKSNVNFVHAIKQCCSIGNINLEEITYDFTTLREAIEHIENNSNLEHVRQAISSIFTNYYLCPGCQRRSNSLASLIDSVSIYQQPANDSVLTAIPFVWSASASQMECPKYTKRIGDVMLILFRQTHQRCPMILMLQAQKTSRQQIMDLRFNLINDSTKVNYTYKFVSVLLVDQYNSISLIKFSMPDNWMVYCEAPHSVSASLSDTEIDGLCVTAQAAILFLERVS